MNQEATILNYLLNMPNIKYVCIFDFKTQYPDNIACFKTLAKDVSKF
jgi:hypothetical protein